MSVIILIILLIMIVLGMIVVVGLALRCRGQASAGPTEMPINGVIHVRVSAITCRSFSVQFETIGPMTEVSGTIGLAEGIVHTVAVTYPSSSPQTHHELTFSNGSVGLAMDTLYPYWIMGRGDYDHEPGAEITYPFLARTASCCAEDLLPFIYRIMEIDEMQRLPRQP